MLDFTDHDRPTEPVKFLVDGDEFECAAVLPAGVTHDFAAMTKMESADQVVLLGHVLDSIFLPESAVRFAARLRDPVKPITSKQLGAIIKGLMEHYGQRPTEPVSTSSDGPTTGTTN